MLAMDALTLLGLGVALDQLQAAGEHGEQVVEVVRDAAGHWPSASIFCAWRSAPPRRADAAGRAAAR
jgi:hypothetical protein